jgi:oligopeptide/dipeptide ABC transporter ATP-binding protein
MPLLNVDGLTSRFTVRTGRYGGHRAVVRAVEDVSFALAQGEVLGLVGESGCGKTTLARAILRMAPITAGRVCFEGIDLATLRAGALRRMRPRIQMIFQDPYASLNPRMTVFDAIAEPLRAQARLHGARLTREDITRRAGTLMDEVGLARRTIRKYPHEFSGGQRQRIAIARALALAPRLIIADEPVSALDVSVQAQIINLLGDLVKEHGLSMIFISHDLSVVRHMASRIAVMYLGRMVETAPAEALFARPAHPYTQALIAAAPLPDPVAARQSARPILLGDPPSPIAPPPGCAFHPRCPWAAGVCRESVPPLIESPVIPKTVPARATACVRLETVLAAPPEA